MGLGGDQTEPLDLSVRKKKNEYSEDSPEKNNDDGDDAPAPTQTPAISCDRTSSPKKADSPGPPPSPSGDSVTPVAAADPTTPDDPTEFTFDDFMEYYADATFQKSNEKEEEDPMTQLF